MTIQPGDLVVCKDPPGAYLWRVIKIDDKPPPCQRKDPSVWLKRVSLLYPLAEPEEARREAKIIKDGCVVLWATSWIAPYNGAPEPVQLVLC